MGRRSQEEGLWFKNKGRVLEVTTTDAKRTIMSGDQTTNAYYKTPICRKFQAGHCVHGSTCRYAHGVPDIRNPMQVQVLFAGNESRKEMVPCRNFLNRGRCDYGDKCQFLHGRNGLFGDAKRGVISSGDYRVNDKRNPCFNWRAKGFCRFGDGCRFSHATTADDQYRFKTSAEFKSGEGAMTASKDHQSVKGASSTGIRKAYQTASGTSSAGVRIAYPTVQGTASNGIRDAFRDSKKLAASVFSESPMLRKNMKKINGIYADWIDESPLE